MKELKVKATVLLWNTWKTEGKEPFSFAVQSDVFVLFIDQFHFLLHFQIIFYKTFTSYYFFSNYFSQKKSP